jgi:hypothetical protein
VGGQLDADRSEQQPGETAQTSGADHDQLRGPRVLDQHRSWGAGLQHDLDGQFGIGLPRLRLQGGEQLAGLGGRVADPFPAGEEPHWSKGDSHRVGLDEAQRRAQPPGLPGAVRERGPGSLRSVDSHHDGPLLCHHGCLPKSRSGVAAP